MFYPVYCRDNLHCLERYDINVAETLRHLDRSLSLILTTHYCHYNLKNFRNRVLTWMSLGTALKTRILPTIFKCLKLYIS